MLDRHNEMMNVTSSIGVRIQNLPEGSIDWSDATPRQSSHSLGIADFLPTEENARELQERQAT